jgi:hypothetical protein
VAKELKYIHVHQQKQEPHRSIFLSKRSEADPVNNTMKAYIIVKESPTMRI